MFRKTILLATVSFMCLTESALSQVKLDEVIVTATKRAESLQDISISVVSVSGDKISDLAITNAQDVSAYLPAVTIIDNPIGNYVFIRGIGTSGANQGIEQSVSIFHDGIYMGRNQLSRAPFMDVARVEVLRGPQSILFGKNTIGGAVHVIAAKPTVEFEGGVSALYGSDDEVELSGHISGPLSDRLRGRISGRYYETDGYLDNVVTEQDGPGREDWTIRGQLEFDATDKLTISTKLELSEFNRSEQTSQLSVINPFSPVASVLTDLNMALVSAATGDDSPLELDGERAVDNDGGVLLGQVAPVFAGLPGFPDLDDASENDMFVGSVTFDYALGNHSLTATTGYAEYDYVDVCDCDFSAVPLFGVNASEDYKQFSQEIRLTSPVGKKVDYIVGAYYHESDLEFRSEESLGTTIAFEVLGAPSPILVPNLTRDYGFNQDQEQIAVFGSATYNFSDATRLTGGLRYFHEEKTADHFLTQRFTGGWDYSALLGLAPGSIAFGDTAEEYDRFLETFGAEDLGGGVTAGGVSETVFVGLLGTLEHDIQGRKRTEDNVTWSVNLEHDLTDDVLGYASVSTGVKSGGFDARFLQDNDSPFFEYEEETAISYEVGIKSTLFNGAMNVNAAAFFSQIEDYQVSIFDGATAFFVQNTAEVETKGIEVDLNWAVSEDLIVGFSGSLLDATYTDFANAPCFATPVDPIRGDCIGFGTPDAFRDATGDNNIFSPDVAFNVSLDYEKPITDDLVGRANFNISYSDEYFVASDLDPIYGLQDAYTLLNGRIALGHIDDKWEVAFIGRNLTNERISGSSNDVPLTPGVGFAQSTILRSFAAQLSYNW